jgi:hypothetical protein
MDLLGLALVTRENTIFGPSVTLEAVRISFQVMLLVAQVPPHRQLGSIPPLDAQARSEGPDPCCRRLVLPRLSDTALHLRIWVSDLRQDLIRFH